MLPKCCSPVLGARRSSVVCSALGTTFGTRHLGAEVTSHLVVLPLVVHPGGSSTAAAVYARVERPFSTKTTETNGTVNYTVLTYKGCPFKHISIRHVVSASTLTAKTLQAMLAPVPPYLDWQRLAIRQRRSQQVLDFHTHLTGCSPGQHVHEADALLSPFWVREAKCTMHMKPS